MIEYRLFNTKVDGDVGKIVSKKIRWLVTICVIVAAFLGYGFYNSSVFRFRYQVTVEVGTPDGIKSGVSVVEAVYWRNRFGHLFLGPGFPSTILGEALFVDLGRGQNLLPTLTTIESNSRKLTRPEYLPLRLYNLPWGRTNAVDAMKDAIQRANNSGSRMLSFDMLPLLIRFRDIRDPTSFEELDPNDLASKYGPGYSLKSATLKPSTDEITDQLDRILVWLPALKNRRSMGELQNV
ncbi:hypothetical protein [Phyllobacterium sophorae]|uniref:Uncharacterized protein n=1 Tax=Phyllobacterium sophorae TaxID=1520277 RepID=A0A2P7B571_9HYPH|nr:hypothetical protein [Phyllobacterium sophorae]PSH61606.1 hypothetical protein CU103_22630 [Phyllobacterium sophorae]